LKQTSVPAQARAKQTKKERRDVMRRVNDSLEDNNNRRELAREERMLDCGWGIDYKEPQRREIITQRKSVARQQLLPASEFDRE
jgi:hypothetical protein